MVHDVSGSWCVCVVHDVSVWFMSCLCGSWCVCVVHDVSVWFMSCLCGSCHVCVVHGVSVWFMVCLCGSWCVCVVLCWYLTGVRSVDLCCFCHVRSALMSS